MVKVNSSFIIKVAVIGDLVGIRIGDRFYGYMVGAKSLEVFDQLLNAESVGRYYNSHIKNQYKCLHIS